MRLTHHCVSCLFGDLEGALQMLAIEPATRTVIIAEALSWVHEHYHEHDLPSVYITQLHRIIKHRCGLAVPFSDLRNACLVAAKEIAAKIETEAALLSGAARFALLARWTVAANHLDFRTVSTGYDFDVAATARLLRSAVDSGFAVDQIDRMHSLATRAKSVVYVPDNVGELPFDRLLIRELRVLGAQVVVPLRGGPITSDAVMQDGIDAGLDTEASALILAGPDTLGLSDAEMDPACATALAGADLIVSKGQANYYFFSEFRSRYPGAAIALLFSSKCDCVSGAFGLQGKLNIAAVL